MFSGLHFRIVFRFLIPGNLSVCNGKVDLVFVLDASQSVENGTFQTMLDFCIHLLLEADLKSNDVRVGMLVYDTNETVIYHLDKYENSTELALYAVWDITTQKMGSTNTAGALQIMRDEMFTPENGDRPEATNVAVLVTDGMSNKNSGRTIQEANAAHDKDIHIYAVGVGLRNIVELYQIASQPLFQRAFLVPEFSDILMLASDLGKRIYRTTCTGMRQMSASGKYSHLYR